MLRQDHNCDRGTLSPTPYLLYSYHLPTTASSNSGSTSDDQLRVDQRRSTQGRPANQTESGDHGRRTTQRPFNWSIS